MIGSRVGTKAAFSGSAVGSSADDEGAAAGGTTTQTVSITDSADPVITGGDAFSYTVQYTNTGGAAATSVSVAVTLDASLTYVSATGTGWSISQSGGVVTCTQASVSPGAASAITVNVTTGGSALTATTTAQATAANASTANGSQNTTVNLVSKDATAGIYFPASATEWTNFINRKGLSISAPDGLWLCQEASGNLADSIGSVTLTKGGATQSYQQTVTGLSRKYVLMGTDGAGGSYTSTSASLPDLSASSMLTLSLVVVPSASPAGTRNVITMGTTGANRAGVELLNTGKVRGIDTAANAANAANAYTGTNTFRPTSFRHNHTATTATGFTDSEKLSPTYSASATGKGLGIGSTSNTAIAGGYAYMVSWYGANAEVSDANWKAVLQAMGFTITWT